MKRVSDIENVALRRAALLIVVPAVTLWKWPQILLVPFLLIGRCACAACGAIAAEAEDTFADPDFLLLCRGVAALWSAQWATDREAAYATAKKIGARK